MRFLLSAGLGASVAAAAFPDLLNLPKPSGAQPLYPAQNSAPKRLSGLSTPPWPVFAASSSGSRACAQVAALNATAQLTVPARLAYDCLQSVPLHTDDALEFVESVRPYVEWQTTLAYLKHPPPGYLEPAVDVKAYLDNITTNLHNGVYKSEYDFEFDLYHAFQLTHDGHFRIFPNILSIFTFRRPISLVSVSPSPNSEQLPKPYVYADIVHHLAAGNSSVQPSAVSKIDGQDALTYLENWSQVGSLQDPDALYNNNFFSLAALAIGSAGTGGGSFAGYGRGGYNYPGPTTTLTFENGTTTTFANFAVLTQNFTGIKSGEDVYYKFVNLPEYVPAPNEPTSMTPVPAPGYPPPVVKEYNNYIGGYFVDEPGYEDIAVLSMPSFVGDGPAPGSFQAVGLDFLYKSKQAGKTKLIIDVSINGGGTVHEGYNLFAELFPHLVPYGATRFRAHEAYNIMGNFISNVSGPVYPPDDTGRYEIDNFLGTPFDYRADVNESYAPFTSWQEKFGPRQFEGDEFTPILRWNLSDFYGIGLNVSGYGNRSHVVNETFYSASDMVIVYDGYCASTCTIFSEFMRQQGHVRAIALGGRSRPGIIQAVGGVKGTNDYPWTNIYTLVNSTFALASPAEAAALSNTPLANYSTLPFRRSSPSNNAINVRDGLRKGDASQTPLQFRYEPADCRIYYTPEMTVQATAIWTAAADVAWGGLPCAAGSLTAPGYRRRELPRRKRALSGPVDAAGILGALANLQQGPGYGGNGYMPPI